MAARPRNIASRRAISWQHPHVIRPPAWDKLETRDPAGAGERLRHAACPAAGTLAGPSLLLLGPRCQAGGGLRGFVADRGAELSASMNRRAPVRYSYAAHGLAARKHHKRRKNSMPGDSAVPVPMSSSNWFDFDSIVHTRPRTPRCSGKGRSRCGAKPRCLGPVMPLPRFSADWRGCKPPRRSLHRQRFNPARDPLRSRWGAFLSWRKCIQQWQ